MSIEQVKQTRNDLHTMPEKPFQEVKTAAYLADKLKKAGFNVTENFGDTTCVIATLKGKEAGPVVAVRGDMDALAHMVDGQECMVHSCGHDANCAMVVTMAEEIAKTGIAKGTLKIVFQPAEETTEGALAIIKAGAIDDVDYMLGIHLRPIQEIGLGKAAAALKHGAAGHANAIIKGKTAHGARPHLGANAIDATVAVINAVNSIKENPLEAWSIKPTRIHADNNLTNAIPDQVNFTVDIRAQTNPTTKSLLQKFQHMVETVPVGYGCTGEVTSSPIVPGADLDEDVTDMIADVITQTMGADALVRDLTTTGGDDFHCYKAVKPTIKAGFIGLGADLSPGLHTINMNFDDNALPIGVKLLMGCVNKLLN